MCLSSSGINLNKWTLIYKVEDLFQNVQMSQTKKAFS